MLVHAAGSGVGVAAVQIAQLLGARVIATAGLATPSASGRGPSAPTTPSTTRPRTSSQEVKRLTGKRGVDVVFEHAGKMTWEIDPRGRGIGGRIVTVGATTGYDPPTDLRHVFFRQLSILGSTMGTAGGALQVLRFVARGQAPAGGGPGDAARRGGGGARAPRRARPVRQGGARALSGRTRRQRT